MMRNTKLMAAGALRSALRAHTRSFKTRSCARLDARSAITIRITRSLVSVLLIAGAATNATARQTTTPTTPLTPPLSPVVESRLAGRPPVGPLVREDPRVIEFRFRTAVFTDIPVQDATQRRVINVVDAPIVLPFIPRSTWSAVDTDTFTARLWLDAREIATAGQDARFELNKAFGMGFAILPIRQFSGQAFQWEITFRTQVWSSRIDDVAAGTIPWPQQWPAECDDALNPQAWIDSDHPIFAEFVERTSQGQLRNVAPYFAAKDLIRAAIDSFRVTSNGTIRRDAGAFVGMELSTASEAARLGMGTAHDLVSICVAVLRAAGIPARPVIGVDRDPVRNVGNAMVSWAEFFLPDSGWVPFDPSRLRNAALGPRHVRDAWPGLGTMRDLNRRVPIAFTFHPPATLISHEWPAVWGWDPRPSGAPASTRQLITLTTVNRGQGTPDPR